MKKENKRKSSLNEVISITWINSNINEIFGGLQAVYRTYSSEDIGCSIHRLYQLNLSTGHKTKNVLIKKHIIQR